MSEMIPGTKITLELLVVSVTPPDGPTPPDPPDPNPGAWSVAAPGSTGGKVTKITDAPGISFNSPDSAPGKNAVDVAVTRGGDTAYLFGAPRGETTPRLIQRSTAIDAAAGNAVSWGKHAVYADATLDISDFNATPSQYAASGISFRWAGANKLRRATIGTQQAPFPLPLTFYDSGEGFGSLDLDQVIVYGSSDTAVWCSINPDFGGSKVQCHFTIGPQFEAHVTGGSKLFNAELWDPQSTLKVSKRATVNGKAATAASINGVPANAITWTD